MKLLVYSSMLSLERGDVLSKLGLKFDERAYSIMGVGFQNRNSNVQDAADCSNLYVLLADQRKSVESIINILPAQEDWAIVLHSTGASALYALYGQLSYQALERKVIYRYENSGWGDTFDFLNNFPSVESSEDEFRDAFSEYFKKFEIDARNNFLEDLWGDIQLVEKPLRSFIKGDAVPYLWRAVFEQYPDLTETLRAYFNSSDRKERRSLLFEIREKLDKI